MAFTSGSRPAERTPLRYSPFLSWVDPRGHFRGVDCPGAPCPLALRLPGLRCRRLFFPNAVLLAADDRLGGLVCPDSSAGPCRVCLSTILWSLWVGGLRSETSCCRMPPLLDKQKTPLKLAHRRRFRPGVWLAPETQSYANGNASLICHLLVQDSGGTDIHCKKTSPGRGGNCILSAARLQESHEAERRF